MSLTDARKEFFHSLDRNLETVSDFYNRKLAEYSRRLKLLQERYGRVALSSEGIDNDEHEELMAALLELRAHLRKLQWYGEVNRRGFVKITKKLDKKVSTAKMQERYVSAKVDPQPFATNFRLLQHLRSINDWLSALAETKVFDDNSSSYSSLSLRTATSKATSTVSSNLLDSADLAIRNDDALQLAKIIAEGRTRDDTQLSAHQRLLLSLLQRSIQTRARACVKSLLEDLSSLDDEDDINGRNCMHRFVIAMGRSHRNENGNASPNGSGKPVMQHSNYLTPAASPISTPAMRVADEHVSSLRLRNDDEPLQFLSYILKILPERHRPALVAKDSYRRIPLHYAAQHGFAIVCQLLLDHMRAWELLDLSQGFDSFGWQDSDGYAPIHLSVMEGHPLTTEVLIKTAIFDDEHTDRLFASNNASTSGAVLALATKRNFTHIVELLVEAGLDVNYRDDQGETALHVAARFGHHSCAKALIAGSDTQRTDLDIREKTFGWTPLFIACVDGHLPIVDILVEAGADLGSPDLSGWTAKEHAALRGHLEIMKRLAQVTNTPLSTHDSSTTNGMQNGTADFGPPEISSGSLDERRSRGIAKDASNGRTPEPVKTFGHRYLTKESMVLVSLGSMDFRKGLPAVKLDDIPLTDAHATELDTALSVVISAVGASGEPAVIDLPVQENISTDPISFPTTDASQVKILFDIVPTYAGSHSRIVGRAVAVLSLVKPSLGSKRISLQGDVSVPVIAAGTLDVIGTVNFNFLIITPFSHPNMKIDENQTYWKSMASTMVIGHRGLGKNMPSYNSLQLGENTISSFIAAANLGASYVEFDVQLTKDHVPVIYHDFLVSETGVDAPVHTLTLEQFLHVSRAQTPEASRPTSPERRDNGSAGAKTHSTQKPQYRHRSYSMGGHEDSRATDMNERMKHTRDFKQKGFKGNSRGRFIQEPFTTLEEMFKKLPESVGFNIEMKYPMLFESEEQEMDTYAVELNSFVDTVLTKVYDLGKKRNIIFSSFNPDICLLLSLKQPSIPILFLSDAGTNPVGDIRASSLQEAIRFASRWNLLGVVSAAEPLVACPRLVRVVKESGLVCVSYGTLNNDPKNVKLQVKEGIDAVIVDSVLAIRKGLTEASKQAESAAVLQPKVAYTVNGVPIYDHHAVQGAIFS